MKEMRENEKPRANQCTVLFSYSARRRVCSGNTVRQLLVASIEHRKWKKKGDSWCSQRGTRRDETTSTSIVDCNIQYFTALYFEYYTYFGVGASAAVAAAVAHGERDAERDEQQHEQQDQQNLRVRAETRRAINARELLDSFGGDYDLQQLL